MKAGHRRRRATYRRRGSLPFVAISIILGVVSGKLVADGAVWWTFALALGIFWACCGVIRLYSRGTPASPAG